MQIPSPKEQKRPFFLKGSNESAVLLLHGFTGLPFHMRSLAEHLHTLGFSVKAPLLHGHGLKKEDLEKTTWQDWYQTANASFQELQRDYSHVAVGGLSMGGLLSLKLASQYPEKIAAVMSLAAPLRLKNWVEFLMPVVSSPPVSWFYSYRKKIGGMDIRDRKVGMKLENLNEMPISCIKSLMNLQKELRRDLSKITSPIFVAHGIYDHTAPFDSASQILAGVSSTHKEFLKLENSAHKITLDYDHEFLERNIGEFLNDILNS